jgi:hypothetical protein
MPDLDLEELQKIALSLVNHRELRTAWNHMLKGMTPAERRQLNESLDQCAQEIDELFQKKGDAD